MRAQLWSSSKKRELPHTELGDRSPMGKVRAGVQEGFRDESTLNSTLGETAKGKRQADRPCTGTGTGSPHTQ